MKLDSLGKYQLIKRIAVGGMSEIFLASQGGLEGFERAVIVKCIREDLHAEREVAQMFLDEARIAACLKHSNIVHLYDVGQDDRDSYLAMEYIFGRDLMQIGERARRLGWELPIPFLVKVMCDCLAGLHYAHEVAEFEDRPLKMIHRDISPQNIIVSFDGVTKLLDFGIAKAEARLSKTRAGVLKGKYAYMSPEQVRGKPLDHRTDLFSLGVVFYEVITGTRLFQRDTDYSTMEAVDRCEVPPIRVLRKDVPRRLMRVLRKAMRSKPNRRFGSAKDMERTLSKLLKGSAVEQASQVSGYMRKLFAHELDVRDQALEEAAEGEREIILSTGFEMIGEKDTRVSPVPEAPLALRRYQEILAEREGEQTQIREAPGPPTARARPGNGRKAEVATGPDLGPDTTVQRRTGRAMLNDWRFLLLVFLGVLVVVLFFLTVFRGPKEVEVPPPEIGMEPMKSAARPGLDGHLSVSVHPEVQVLLDGKDMGKGAFRLKPLEAGMHELELRHTGTGETRKIRVHIRADKESIVAPAAFQ